MKAILAQLLLLSTLNGAEALKVKVMDTKTASPVKGVAVQIVFEGGPEYEPYKPVPHSSNTAITDSSGSATFAINPQPGQFVIVAFSEQCAAERASFSLQEILTLGVVVENHCYHRNPKLNNLKRKPGEILFFRDRLSFFERLAHARDAQ